MLASSSRAHRGRPAGYGPHHAHCQRGRRRRARALGRIPTARRTRAPVQIPAPAGRSTSQPRPGSGGPARHAARRPGRQARSSRLPGRHPTSLLPRGRLERPAPPPPGSRTARHGGAYTSSSATEATLVVVGVPLTDQVRPAEGIRRALRRRWRPRHRSHAAHLRPQPRPELTRRTGQARPGPAPAARAWATHQPQVTLGPTRPGSARIAADDATSAAGCPGHRGPMLS